MSQRYVDSPKISPRRNNERIEENAIEARQGFRDRQVLVVLVASTALLALLYAILWLFFAEPAPQPGTAEPPAVTGTTQTAPQ